MLACRIHAKEDLRIEPVAVPEAGPGEVLLRLGAARHLRLRPPLLLRGPQRQLRRARAAHSRATRRRPWSPRSARASRASRSATRWPCRRRMRAGAASYCREGREQLCIEHALSRQREPVPARAGHVPGIFRHGRAAVLSGRRRHLARRARVRRAAGGRPARRQPRRRPARQVGADHRRRHDRLRHGAWRRGSPARARSPSPTCSTVRSRRRSSSAPT